MHVRPTYIYLAIGTWRVNKNQSAEQEDSFKSYAAINMPPGAGVIGLALGLAAYPAGVFGAGIRSRVMLAVAIRSLH